MDIIDSSMSSSTMPARISPSKFACFQSGVGRTDLPKLSLVEAEPAHVTFVDPGVPQLDLKEAEPTHRIFADRDSARGYWHALEHLPEWCLELMLDEAAYNSAQPDAIGFISTSEGESGQSSPVEGATRPAGELSSMTAVPIAGVLFPGVPAPSSTSPVLGSEFTSYIYPIGSEVYEGHEEPVTIHLNSYLPDEVRAVNRDDSCAYAHYDGMTISVGAVDRAAPPRKRRNRKGRGRDAALGLQYNQFAPAAGSVTLRNMDAGRVLQLLLPDSFAAQAPAAARVALLY